MLFKLKSVFVSTRRDNDKPEKINISLFSSYCLSTLCFNTMKHFRFADKIEASLNLFFFIYLFPGVWVFEIFVWVSWKLRPRETNKENRFKLVSIVLSKMLYGHAMFIDGNSQKRSRYLSFPVYRCRVPWIQKLNPIWTTFFGNKIRLQMSSNLVSTPLDEF